MVSAFAIILTVIVAYSLFMRWLAYLTRSKRNRLITIAETLARHEQFPDKMRPILAWMVEIALSPQAMVFAALAFPSLLLGGLCGKEVTLPRFSALELSDVFEEFITLRNFCSSG